ncbi:hypothetical protein QJS10_CPA01g00166 [Acorus calamus]|uniref:Uncharacterized protein n=1 Tax=Acorus calamus TaxID=4465 RepID=A0AAV9FHU2_ACOCL|nr:hypothetical protein QJS10_CPA01g00166 [Acorus calamus]
MALLSISSSPNLFLHKFNLPNTETQRLSPSKPQFNLLRCRTPSLPSRFPLFNNLISTNRTAILASVAGLETSPYDADDSGSPWEGAIVYRRHASASHVEYSTTLERLGLGRLSSRVSASRASSMGLRMSRRGVRGDSLETPVLVSVDVTRRKRKLKLDGILRTVITLGCNRCAEPAAQPVFTNFSLLLTEEPIEEPEEIDMGTIFGEVQDEDFVDLDDQLYFPPEEKEIDISKHLRDMVHLEITISAVCDASCKGLCLTCGVNLNRGSCDCGRVDEVSIRDWNPLKDIANKMHQT